VASCGCNITSTSRRSVSRSVEASSRLGVSSYGNLTAFILDADNDIRAIETANGINVPRSRVPSSCGPQVDLREVREVRFSQSNIVSHNFIPTPGKVNNISKIMRTLSKIESIFGTRVLVVRPTGSLTNRDYTMCRVLDFSCDYIDPTALCAQVTDGRAGVSGVELSFVYASYYHIRILDL